MANSSFSQMYITNKGRSLLIEAQAGARIQFTRVAIGKGTMKTSETENTMESVIDFVKDFNISKLSVIQGQANLVVQGDNTDIAVTTQWRELAVFAKNLDETEDVGEGGAEILYLYGYAGDMGEWIPAYSDDPNWQKMFSVIMNVANVDEEKLNISVSESLVYTTRQEANAIIADLDAHRLDSEGEVISNARHVPAIETASKNRFLRNDNTWATITPSDIGASPSDHNHDGSYVSFKTAQELSDLEKIRARLNMGAGRDCYDVTIRTQSEFSDFVKVTGWKTESGERAKSVLFAGNFLYDGWITIPAEVKTIAGINGATITMTVTAAGKFGYANKAAEDCSITGLNLIIDATNSNASNKNFYGFYRMKNMLDCSVVFTGTGDTAIDAVGFYGCEDVSNCYSEVNVENGAPIAFNASRNLVNPQASAITESADAGYGYVSCDGCTNARGIDGKNCTTALWGSGNSHADAYSCEGAPNGVLFIRNQTELDAAVSNGFYNASEAFIVGGVEYGLSTTLKLPETLKRLSGIGNPVLKFNLPSSMSALEAYDPDNKTQVVDHLTVNMRYSVSSTDAAELTAVKGFMSVDNCIVIVTATKGDNTANSTAYLKAVGFGNCTNISNCSVELTANSNITTGQTEAYQKAIGFDGCENISNCRSDVSGYYSKDNGSSTLEAYGYNGCRNLVSCKGKYTTNNVVTETKAIFHECAWLTGCEKSDSGTYTVYDGCTETMICAVKTAVTYEYTES